MPLPTPHKGEKKEDFINRCMGDDVMISEYDDNSQRYAICTDCWSKHFGSDISKFWYEDKLNGTYNRFKSVEELNLKLQEQKFAGRVSMDYDDTLSTDKGKLLAKKLLKNGVDLSIITRRQQNDLGPVLKVAAELGIPSNKVHATNGKLKWEEIKRLHITKHYDNNPKELEAIRKNLPDVKTVQFSTEQFKSYSDYPDSVKHNAKRGIELNEKNGNKCATQTGKVRAQQLANGEPISEDTIKRMYSYLSRAETYYDEGNTKACGTISYLLWGGKSALSWAGSKMKTFATQIKPTTIVCENCGHMWDLKDGGTNPYQCNVCGHDNSDQMIVK